MKEIATSAGLSDPSHIVAQPIRALDRGMLAADEVVGRTLMVRRIMESVMKEGTHFGTIPGTPKPSLYQPGCDVLAVTFRIAPKISLVEDLSNGDSVRYRITVGGVHQVTGELLAEGIGECSSDEEKYRWRKPVCDEEFNDTPLERRREKWARGNQKPYKQKQIRTSPPDVANTVLKMATKRAKVAMILNATAASDVFSQDIEDLSEELRDLGAEPTAPVVPMPKASGPAAADAPVTSEPQQQAQAKPAAPFVPDTPNTEFSRERVTVKAVEPAATKDKLDDTGAVIQKGRPFALVTLSTGEQFQCWHTNKLAPTLEGWRDAKTIVNLACKTARDVRFRPTIESGAAA
ncbi:MAG: hypothetical protein IT181_13005 [Acidobacteria bacterium]|nr:hypothetical protein [Acidobacteriota bacterium]